MCDLEVEVVLSHTDMVQHARLHILKSLTPSLKEYDVDELVIISGARLNWGTDVQDYSVDIGSQGSCRVTSLSANRLACQPPAEEPDHNPSIYISYNGRRVPNVKVSFRQDKLIYLACSIHSVKLLIT